MITFEVLFFGFFAITTQVATYKDVKVHRVERSPHYGGYFHGPPPFFPHPLPFIYHTDNWSGVGRGNDGPARSVYSGAAAAAAENAAPNLNGAFSVAEAGATSSADCDDNSHSAAVKGTGQYSSQSSQFSSQPSGSGSNSQLNLIKSTTASSQFGQNSASNGFGQQSSRGYDSLAPGFSSGHGIQSGGYGGYKGSFKEPHYFVHNNRGNEFGSQASNGENTQASSNNQIKSSSTDSNGNNEAFTQGSAQRELGLVESNQGNFSGSGLSGSSGSNKHQFQGSSSESAGNAEVFSHGSVPHSSSFGSHDNFGASSLGEIQSSSNNLESNQGYSGAGQDTFSGFGKYRDQHQLSSGTGNFGTPYQKLTQGASRTLEPNLGNRDEHSGYIGFGRHQGQDSSYGSNGNFGAFSQGYAQSSSNSFGSVNNGHSHYPGFESSKLQAGDSESLKSKQLESASGSKQSGQYEAGINGYQTSDSNANGAAGYSQQQSTLHGALDLAAQGLQAADKAKCSTCQKSSYALSNAKSYNGAAIALSIGG